MLIVNIRNLPNKNAIAHIFKPGWKVSQSLNCNLNMIMKSEELRVATRNVLEQGFMSGKGVATFASFTIDDLYSIFDF